jgi:hypothetical protein
MSDNPNCLTPITSSNLPAATVKPPLTVLECQLGPAFATLNGVHTLYLNGKDPIIAMYSVGAGSPTINMNFFTMFLISLS